MIYSGYTRNGIDGIRAITTNLLSQSVEETLVTDTEVAPTMTTEQVTDRIRRIEIEILEETHDPDRIMELRRELYKLKNIQSKS